MKITPVERLEDDIRRQKEKSYMVRLDITKIPKKVRAKILERYDAWEFQSGVNLRLFSNLLFDIAMDLWEQGTEMSFKIDLDGQKGAIIFDVGRSVFVKARCEGGGWTEEFEDKFSYWSAFVYSCKLCMQKLLDCLDFPVPFKAN